MARFSPPPLRFPIGQFEVPGQRDPVYVYPDQAFWDYFISIFERIGGENGLSTDEVVALIQQTQASETLMQPVAAQALLPDLLQPVQQVQDFADLLQPAVGGQLSEMTFQ